MNKASVLLLLVVLLKVVYSDEDSKLKFKQIPNDCVIQTNAGTLDLKPLSNNNFLPRFRDRPGPDSQYLYSWNPCSGFNELHCTNTALCQTFGNGGGAQDSYALGYTNLVNFQEVEDHSGALIYTTKDPQMGQIRTSTILLTCEPSTEGEFNVKGENPILTYTFELVSKYACPQTSTAIPTPSGGVVTAPPSPAPRPRIFSIKAITILLFSILCSVVIIGILLLISVIAQIVQRNNSTSKTEKSDFAYKNMA